MLSIVVPVFNEEAAIATTVRKLFEVSAQLRARCAIDRVQLVFVDDGSLDRSVDEIHAVGAPPLGISIEIVRFSRNFGHGPAVFAGLERGEGDLYAILDADLQDPPALLADMIETLRREKADVVYGLRRQRAGESVFKRLSAWAFYRAINWLSGTAIPKDTGDFRVLTREVRDAVLALGEREPFLRGLIAWVGYRQVPFAYDREPRRLGETKYPFRRMLRFGVQAILSFSSFPLKLSIYVGFAGMLASTAVATYAVFEWWNGVTVPGWASLIIGFSYGQSITFFLIGVLGLYVGRVHTASQGRPRYIVRQDEKPKQAQARRQDTA